MQNQTNKKITWIDFVVVAAVIGFIVFVIFRVGDVLNYHWNWSAILPFIAYKDDETGGWVANLLVLGLVTSIRLALWGILISAVIGLVMGLCRTSNNLFLRMVSRVYVEFVRNMPPIVFIFIFYFFLSSQLLPLLGVDEFARNASPTTQKYLSFFFGDPILFGNFISGLICLAIFEGAYITEIVRAGLQAIPRGQWEAGRSVGLSNYHVLRYIIVPQAVQKIVPPLANQFITLIKDSSIVSLISIQELTFMAIEVGVSTTRVFEVWITVAVMYFVICYGCAYWFTRMEKRILRSR